MPPQKEQAHQLGPKLNQVQLNLDCRGFWCLDKSRRPSLRNYELCCHLPQEPLPLPLTEGHRGLAAYQTVPASMLPQSLVKGLTHSKVHAGQASLLPVTHLFSS